MPPETDRREKDKWDEYYRQRNIVPAEPDLEQFYLELARAMLALIPSGGSVLEAGCGGGMHSLALARQGGCRVRLMDFSPEAIRYAQKVFTAAGEQADFEVGDVFTTAADPDQDLVFNSGVLEHYDFDRQVAFIRGMARRSRRFVFVMVPNRECYWYWIWRVRTAAAGQWPFGYEKPAGDYRAVIEAAGLHYLGRAYFGAAAVNRFLASLEGLSPTLRELVEQVHDRQVVSPAQRSYLVGFLASVAPGERTPPGFNQDLGERGYLDSDRVDRYITLLGDSLAAQIAAEYRLKDAEAQLAEARRQQQDLEARNRVLTESLAAREQEMNLLRQSLKRTPGGGS